MKLRVLVLLLMALAFASCATYQMDVTKTKSTVKKPSVSFTPGANGVLLSAFGDPATEKGLDFGKPQPRSLQDAFRIESPPDLPNGVLYERTPALANGMVEFINLNNNDPNQPEKVFYYQVTAARCDGTGGPAVTDPAIRNTGGGGGT